MSLHELQKNFLNHLLNPEQFELAVQINDSARMSAQDCIEVYRGSVLGNWNRCLREIYPVCARLVGDEFFIAMADIYVRQAVSRSPDLNDYGETFPTFIENFTPAKTLPYLVDVAHLEWLWHRAFHGPDATTLDVNALAQVMVEVSKKIIFQLPANAGLLTSIYPVDRIWETNQVNYIGDTTVQLDQQQIYLIVWRKDLLVSIERLTENEWKFLQVVREGMRFDVLCDQLYAQNINVVELLPQVAARGWIGGFVIT